MLEICFNLHWAITYSPREDLWGPILSRRLEVPKINLILTYYSLGNSDAHSEVFHCNEFYSSAEFRQDNSPDGQAEAHQVVLYFIFCKSFRNIRSTLLKFWNP